MTAHLSEGSSWSSDVCNLHAGARWHGLPVSCRPQQHPCPAVRMSIASQQSCWVWTRLLILAGAAQRVHGACARKALAPGGPAACNTRSRQHCPLLALSFVCTGSRCCKSGESRPAPAQLADQASTSSSLSQTRDLRHALALETSSIGSCTLPRSCQPLLWQGPQR